MLPKPSKDDRRRHHEVEQRIKKEGMQLDYPKEKELFGKVMIQARKK